MKKKFNLQIDKKGINKFCKITNDKNVLHSKDFSEIYDGKFKKILVPGILIFTKINQILSKKYKGAILLDVVSNFKQPVYANEKHTVYYAIKLINKKNNLLELKAEVRKSSIIKAFFKINFIIPKK